MEINITMTDKNGEEANFYGKFDQRETAFLVEVGLRHLISMGVMPFERDPVVLQPLDADQRKTHQ